MEAILWLIGGFLAVSFAIWLLVRYVRRKNRRFSRDVFGTTDMIGALKQIDTSSMDTPRSLSGCDSLLLPKILKDFPDFDVDLAKTYVRDELKRRFGHQTGFRIHNVVITKYLRSAAQKCIVFQAATCAKENSRTIQRRYDLYYTFILPDQSGSVAANCPNCSAALGFGDTTCAYCGSRIVNVLGNTWELTDVRET